MASEEEKPSNADRRATSHAGAFEGESRKAAGQPADNHIHTSIASRRRMVESQLRARGIKDQSVLEAFLEIPRERFVPEDKAHEAYCDYPIPIGCGQTVSQPYVVALMLEALGPKPHHNVLDIGAGSGFQTALLAKMVRHVYAIERIDTLAERAMRVLSEMNVQNVSLCMNDGSLGWPEEAPFDGIICGAAAPEVPPTWANQLADGGRIVMPIGGHDVQTLTVIEKSGSKLTRSELCEVRFVKLIGRDGWPA